MYFCPNCNSTYSSHSGYVDFLDDDFYAGEVSKNEMVSLNSDIDSNGYEQALKGFLERHPELTDYITDTRRLDWIYHCIQADSFYCLDIGSGLGNISENLSHIFHKVYSLEAVKERLEFQKRRFHNSNRSNIVMVRGNGLSLPFEDGSFDLVVCNGFFEWVGMMNTDVPPKLAQLKFLREVNRVLSKKGCLYIGIENRFGFQFFLGANDHSGLPYTSLMPRTLSNIVVKQFGRAGGIYGDKSQTLKEKRGYFTYTYGIKEYFSLLREAGFKVSSYWTFPSYNHPLFSGKINDNVSLKGFIKYLKDNSSRHKTLLKLIHILPKSILGWLTGLFAPSFLLYCYRNDCESIVDDALLAQTSFQHHTLIGEGSKAKYLLYNSEGEPLKIVHVKRGKINFPHNLSTNNTANSKIKSQGVWMEDWRPGRILNPSNKEECNLAIQWLIDFQKKTRSAPLTTTDLLAEKAITDNLIDRVSPERKMLYKKWVDEYVSYLSCVSVYKTSQHGDYWYRNILYDNSQKRVHVIDWDNFKEEGNPIYDIVFFILTAMLYPNDDSFILNLSGKGQFNKILMTFHDKIESHLGFAPNYDILLKYVALKFTYSKKVEKGSQGNGLEKYEKVLEVLSSLHT